MTLSSINRSHTGSELFGTTVKWLARLASIALTGLFSAFLFGEERLPVLSQESMGVQLIFLGWGIIFLGYLVGWRFPTTGGVLVLGALVFMNLVEYSINQQLLGPAFLLWGIPGVLFLIGGLVKGRNNRSLVTPDSI